MSIYTFESISIINFEITKGKDVCEKVDYVKLYRECIESNAIFSKVFENIGSPMLVEEAYKKAFCMWGVHYYRKTVLFVFVIVQPFKMRPFCEYKFSIWKYCSFLCPLTGKYK